MAKYLDDNGLLYFWQQLKAKLADKVDKETGKGLSTNDFTTALKNKLDGIAAGAEVNVNADWNASSGDAQILNKPTIPTKTSDLANDSNYVSDANYVHTDNNFTTALKNKLDGVETGAQVNVIESVKENGTALTITNKEVDVRVPVFQVDTLQDNSIAMSFYEGTSGSTSNVETILTGTWWNNLVISSSAHHILLTILGSSATISYNGQGVSPASLAELAANGITNAIIVDTSYKVYQIVSYAADGALVLANVSSSGVITYITFEAPATLSSDYIAGTVTTKSIYEKPSGGIPSTDLASGVQTSLGLADTALQKKSTAGIVYSAANSTTTSAATAAQIVSAIGNTAVNRATADASGNTITTTYAPLTSPALTGTPTAPTATAGTNTTQIATTAFVTDAVATAITGSASFQGTVDAQSTIQNSNYKSGWYWVVSTAGTYVGQVCEVGDMIYAIATKGSSYSASDFSVVQANLNIVAITNAEIDTILAA